MPQLRTRRTSLRGVSLRRMRYLPLPHLQPPWGDALRRVRGCRVRPQSGAGPATLTPVVEPSAMADGGAIGTAAVAPVLREPSVRSEQITQLVLGETVEILERRHQWRHVRLHRDGYRGWINGGYLTERSRADVEAWRARANGWSDGVTLDFGDGRAMRLPLRARVELEEDGVILPDGRAGRVCAGAARRFVDVVAEAGRQAPERWALERFDGAPYQWGGVTDWGVDCSGLVQTTFAARGIVLPRDSSEQARAGQEVAHDAARPGDLLFFRSESGTKIDHVAFLGPGDTLVHATLACGGALMESWAPGTRASVLRDRVTVVRRIEERRGVAAA